MGGKSQGLGDNNSNCIIIFHFCWVLLLRTAISDVCIHSQSPWLAYRERSLVFLWAKPNVVIVFFKISFCLPGKSSTHTHTHTCYSGVKIRVINLNAEQSGFESIWKRESQPKCLVGRIWQLLVAWIFDSIHPCRLSTLPRPLDEKKEMLNHTVAKKRGKMPISSDFGTRNGSKIAIFPLFFLLFPLRPTP